MPRYFGIQISMGVAARAAKTHTGAHHMPINGGICIINAIKGQPRCANGWPKRNRACSKRTQQKGALDPAGKLQVTDSLAKHPRLRNRKELCHGVYRLHPGGLHTAHDQLKELEAVGALSRRQRIQGSLHGSWGRSSLPVDLVVRKAIASLAHHWPHPRVGTGPDHRGPGLHCPGPRLRSTRAVRSAKGDCL